MKVVVRYKGLNTYSAEGLRFIPGVNEVSLESWRQAQRNKLFVKRINDGILKVVKAPAGYDPYGQPLPRSVDEVEQQAESRQEEVGQPSPDYSLADATAGQAKEIISQTVDISLLKSWSEQESSGKKRKSVFKLLSDRIAELEKAVNPSADEELEDDESAEDDDAEYEDDDE